MTKPRLTPEQAAACDAYAHDRSNRNYTALGQVTAQTHTFFADPLADRVADLLDSLKQAEAIAREGRSAGREEALQIILRDASSADDFANEHTTTEAVGCTGDYVSRWDEASLRRLLNCDAPETKGLIDRLDGAYWSLAAEKMEVEEDRDTLAAELSMTRALLDDKETQYTAKAWMLDRVWKLRAATDASAALARSKVGG